jgi:hypothetical protein
LIALSNAATIRYFSNMSQECLDHLSEISTSNTAVSPNGTGHDELRPIVNELHQNEGAMVERQNAECVENEREDCEQSVPYVETQKEKELQVQTQSMAQDDAPKAHDNVTPADSTSPAK